MLVSPLASSTSPATVFIGQEPSCRWVRGAPVVRRLGGLHLHRRPAAPSRASTWFHTSMCSPTVHGTAPSASCIEAMDAAVCATCALVSTPATDGTGGSGSRDVHGGVSGLRR